MISEREYELLKVLKKSPVVYDDLYADELDGLTKQEMISRVCMIPVNGGRRYSKCTVLPKGEAAIEEYERMLEKQKREEETLDAAREANEIANKSNTLAEQANATANEANKISSKSNLLSKIAICISVASVIATLIVGFCV